MTATRLVRRTKYSGNLLSKLDEVSLRLLFLISYSYFDHISYFEPREKKKVRLLTDYVNLTLMKHFHLYQQAWLRIERRTEALGGVDAGRQGSDPPLPPRELRMVRSWAESRNRDRGCSPGSTKCVLLSGSWNSRFQTLHATQCQTYFSATTAFPKPQKYFSHFEIAFC